MTNQSDYRVSDTAPILDREEDLLSGSLRAGMLNDLLREQLMPTQSKTALTASENNTSASGATAETSITLNSTAVEAVEEILNAEVFDRNTIHDKLSQLFHEQKAVYEATPIDPVLRKRQYINETGLVLSPDNCITTQLDDLRVNGFMRGIDNAIADLLAKRVSAQNNSTIHIVYPACGPFAPLLMPMLAYYKEKGLYTGDQLQVTFIDIQPGAAATLSALILEMGVSDYVSNVLCIDALQYGGGDRPIDIVVLEAMQHGFSREGQFTIARHFARLLAVDGVFLPSEILISAALNDPNREFVAQWQDAKLVAAETCNREVMAERIQLGEVARINRQSLLHSKERVLDQNTSLIEFGKVNIPEFPDDLPEQLLIICTEIQVYGDEWIGEYDSGITHPLPDQQVCINFIPRDDRPGDLLAKSGDTLQFFYRINGLPGFMAVHSME